jgi:hypothetical protein
MFPLLPPEIYSAMVQGGLANRSANCLARLFESAKIGDSRPVVRPQPKTAVERYDLIYGHVGAQAQTITGVDPIGSEGSNQ